jgi:hypothetical protein
MLPFALTPIAVHAAGEPPRRRGPPPEALQACQVKQAEAACSFDAGRPATSEVPMGTFTQDWE